MMSNRFTLCSIAMLSLVLIAVFTTLVLFFSIKSTVSNNCIPRDFGQNSIVCVCNSTYCDSTPEITPDPGFFLWYTSSKVGLRMDLTKGRILKTIQSNETTTTLILNSENRYQKLKGFGGAFTDSSGINIKNLSIATQEKLLETYFSKSGSRYNLGRIPIGGTDFSTRFYTYDDVENDLLLKHFRLAKEDLDYKIPLMQKALELNPELWFLAAAWTAPMWMKTNHNYTGYGFLKKEYYQLYTDYIIKFLNEYKIHGIEMWMISTGNEPAAAYLTDTFPLINMMGWSADDLGSWIVKNLAPALANSQHNRTIILTVDDEKYALPWFADLIFKNNEAMKHVAGLGIHYYVDFVIAPAVLEELHYKYPEMFLLMTEACEGIFPWETQKVSLGDWTRAESYVLDMFENLNHWMSGWVDWNIALDKIGGPTWIRNFADSPIIVNPETDEFFKQPLYYIIHHFSRFLPRDSVRIELKDNSRLASIAFLTPQNETVVLVYNKDGKSEKVDIIDQRNGVICLKIPAKSMNTIIYQS